jgi:hypothetical protein
VAFDGLVQRVLTGLGLGKRAAQCNIVLGLGRPLLGQLAAVKVW